MILCLQNWPRRRYFLKPYSNNRLIRWNYGVGAQTAPETSVHGKSTWIDKYLIYGATYLPHLFQRRFSVPRYLFWFIHDALVRLRWQYWETRKLVGNILGITYFVKVLA